MTDRDMIYRAILTYPAEDAPRLLYADEIADEQPERAEFIRVQCELARTVRNCPGLDLCRFRPCNWCALTRREQELHSWDVSRNKRSAWFPEWLNWTLITDARRPMTNRIALASRGFISSLTCSFADWLAHHERLFWSPGQTVECPCVGFHGFSGCDECSGTGRIPRPFTTAQPIERVRFTMAPWEIDGPMAVGRSWVGGSFTRHPDDAAAELNIWYCDRWPGVTFEMPERANYESLGFNSIPGASIPITHR